MNLWQSVKNQPLSAELNELSQKQGGGSPNGLTQNSWFNSCHGLFSPLTPIVNTNTLSLKHLVSI